MTALERWAREVYAKAAAKPGALRKALFQTSSGIEVKPLYSPSEPPPSLGFPGEYPFTRGVQPTMYRGRFWTMRQYAGFGTAEETNGASITCSAPARRGSPPPSISPRRWATTPTLPAPAARWAGWAWPSTRSTTWSASSRTSTWARSPPR